MKASGVPPSASHAGDTPFSAAVIDGAAFDRQRTHEASLTELMSLSDWYRFVPESLGIVLLIALIRAYGPGLPAGVALPSPFWIPVLLMSGQYGIMGGLFAALSAATVQFATELPPRAPMQDFYVYAGVVAAQPSAWLTTALVLGGLRTLHIHHQADLQSRFDQSRAIAEDLAVGLQQAVDEINRLEFRIASDSCTVASLMRSLAKLDTSDQSALVASIVDVVRFAVGATSFSIYLDRGFGMEPCCGVEDGARIATASIAPLARSLRSAAEATSQSKGPQDLRQDAGQFPLWAAIQPTGMDKPVGMIVCNRLEPACVPSVAAARLRDVCRVLAALLPACANSDCGAVDHANG